MEDVELLLLGSLVLLVVLELPCLGKAVRCFLKIADAAPGEAALILPRAEDKEALRPGVGMGVVVEEEMKDRDSLGGASGEGNGVLVGVVGV